MPSPDRRLAAGLQRRRQHASQRDSPRDDLPERIESEPEARHDSTTGGSMKRLVLVLLSTATALLLVVPRGTAIAGASSTTKALTEPATCAFDVSFTWSGFPGQSDEAEIKLFSGVGSPSRVVGLLRVSGVSGRSGSLSHTWALSSTADKLTFTGSVALYSSKGKTLYSSFT